MWLATRLPVRANFTEYTVHTPLYSVRQHLNKVTPRRTCSLQRSYVCTPVGGQLPLTGGARRVPCDQTLLHSTTSPRKKIERHRHRRRHRHSCPLLLCAIAAADPTLSALDPKLSAASRLHRRQSRTALQPARSQSRLAPGRRIAWHRILPYRIAHVHSHDASPSNSPPSPSRQPQPWANSSALSCSVRPPPSCPLLRAGMFVMLTPRSRFQVVQRPPHPSIRRLVLHLHYRAQWIGKVEFVRLPPRPPTPICWAKS